MKRRKPGKRPKAQPPAPVAGRKGRAGALANPKVGAQMRKVLAKHYASKYQTMRRG
jgi:hypothetical protein